MTEIKAKKASDLMPDEAETLIYWRNDTHETIVYGLSLGVLLKLYHASAAYVDIESWLEGDNTAKNTFRRIAGRGPWQIVDAEA